MTLLLLLQHEDAGSFHTTDVKEVFGTGTAAQEWTYVLGDANGNAIDILDPAIQSAVLSVARNQPASMTFTLSGDDDRAKNILRSLVTTPSPVQTAPGTRCYAYRNGTLKFAGYLSALKSTAGDDHQMTAVFTDALGVLDSRVTDSQFEAYGETTTNLIAGTLTYGNSLLAQANATAATGLVIGPLGALETGTTVDTFTTSRDSVLTKINEITALAGGPNVLVKPVAGSSTFGNLYVGSINFTSSASMANFGYGSGTVGNVTSFDWEIQTPLTRVVGVGTDVEDVSTGSVTAAENRIGVWQGTVINNDWQLYSECVDGANAAQRLDYQTVVAFTPEPAITPRPLRDYTVGDLVTVTANRGSLSYNGTLRVRSITITIDDSGFEVGHEVQCEAGVSPVGLNVNNISALADPLTTSNNNLAAGVASGGFV